MKQRHGVLRPQMECKQIKASFCHTKNIIPSLGHEMDIRDLKFEDGTFDVAIDKGKHAATGHSMD